MNECALQGDTPGCEKKGICDLTKQKPHKLLPENRFLIEIYNRLIMISPSEKIQREIVIDGKKGIETVYINTINKLCEIIELYRDRIDDVDFFMEQVIMRYNIYRNNV